MADLDEKPDTRFDDIDLESILARVERRGPLTFTRKRCLYRAPEFVKKLPKEETVEEGSTIKFECKAVGFPKPTINWTKDLETIPDNPRISFQFGELGEAVIEIQRIKKSDEGSYRCKAENTEGSTSSSIYISIKAKPKSPKRSQERVITFTSKFNTITEKIDEEEKEAEEIRRQPLSPLTYLYDSVTIKAQSWPDFLGTWAFLASGGESLHDSIDNIAFIDDEEDVFLPDSSSSSSSSTNSSSDKDSDNDSLFSNDSSIPNLVFENKNLTNSNKNNYLNKSSTNKTKLLKDENANHRVVVKTPVKTVDVSKRMSNGHPAKNENSNSNKPTKIDNSSLGSSTKIDNSSLGSSTKIDKSSLCRTTKMNNSSLRPTSLNANSSSSVTCNKKMERLVSPCCNCSNSETKSLTSASCSSSKQNDKTPDKRLSTRDISETKPRTNNNEPLLKIAKISNTSISNCGTEGQKSKQVSSSQQRPLTSNTVSKRATNSTFTLATNTISTLATNPVMSTSSSSTRPLTTKTTTKLDMKTNNDSNLSNVFLFIFLVCGFTFLALSLDMSVSSFTFYILLFEIMYLTIRFLCGYS